MGLRVKYTLQKLPDFDLYILVRQSDSKSYGHWSGLETKESMNIILEKDFEPYRLSKKEILDYVQVEIMKQGGRAIDDRICVLQTKDGKRCAFRLCLCDEARNELTKRNNTGFVGNMTDSMVEAILRPEFKGHGKEFWRDVQNLHDNPSYWDSNNTLSEMGVKRYNEILSTPYDEKTL